MGILNKSVKENLIGNIHLLKKVHGYSAYDLAVEHGFNGTVEEWLESLRGKDGDKGDKGTMELHGELDALGERIMNVADPTEDSDAVNLSYLKRRYGAKKTIKLATPGYYLGDYDLVDMNTENFVLMAYPLSNGQNYITRVFRSNNGWSVTVTDRLTGEPYELPADKYELSMTVYYMFGNE